MTALAEIALIQEEAVTPQFMKEDDPYKFMRII